jgi:hypothetical protein
MSILEVGRQTSRADVAANLVRGEELSGGKRSIRGLGMSLAKVPMVIAGVSADGRPEMPVRGPLQPPPGPAVMVLDRRTPGGCRTHIPRRPRVRRADRKDQARQQGDQLKHPSPQSVYPGIGLAG